MTKPNNNRRSGRQPEPPQRVTNAAEQMRNTASYGNTRGYDPRRNANQIPVQGIPGQSGNHAPAYGTPVQQRVQQPAYYAVPQSTGEFRGFGKPAVVRMPAPDP